jgi:hypothetical protein
MRSTESALTITEASHVITVTVYPLLSPPSAATSQTCNPSPPVSKMSYTGLFLSRLCFDSLFVSVLMTVLVSSWLNNCSTPAPRNSSNPVSSEQIGGTSDTAMSATRTALAALKEGSALVARIPYISPIAGLLLQALAMQDVRVRVFLLA